MRISSWQRGEKVVFSVDGESVTGFAGEMLAGALMAHGIRKLRSSPAAGTPRGAFCLMGVCQECVVLIDGTLRQACMATVSAGLEVELLPSRRGAA